MSLKMCWLVINRSNFESFGYSIRLPLEVMVEVVVVVAVVVAVFFSLGCLCTTCLVS